ncbi:MAG: hypothetical protein LBG96_07230, partial [Tannerella sp.]|nr:hypothetical protein [Tannerella sp.]
MPEVIKDHNYANSRFLRGAIIDENKFVPVESPDREDATVSLYSALPFKIAFISSIVRPVMSAMVSTVKPALLLFLTVSAFSL